jgi:hypothetical protein
MRTYRGTDTVEPGVYFNLQEWSFQSIERAAVLPGPSEMVYRRVPTLAMFAAAPFLGLAFVVFLPFIGFAMVAWLLVGKAAALATDALRAAARVVRPNWNPSLAFLHRSKHVDETPTEPVADKWTEEVERKLGEPKGDR